MQEPGPVLQAPLTPAHTTCPNRAPWCSTLGLSCSSRPLRPHQPCRQKCTCMAPEAEEAEMEKAHTTCPNWAHWCSTLGLSCSSRPLLPHQPCRQKCTCMAPMRSSWRERETSPKPAIRAEQRRRRLRMWRRHSSSRQMQCQQLLQASRQVATLSVRRHDKDEVHDLNQQRRARVEMARAKMDTDVFISED